MESEGCLQLDKWFQRRIEMQIPVDEQIGDGAGESRGEGQRGEAVAALSSQHTVMSHHVCSLTLTKNYFNVKQIIGRFKSHNAF